MVALVNMNTELDYNKIEFKPFEKDKTKRCKVCAFASEQKNDTVNCIYNLLTVFKFSSCKHHRLDLGIKQ